MKIVQCKDHYIMQNITLYSTLLHVPCSHGQFNVPPCSHGQCPGRAPPAGLSWSLQVLAGGDSDQLSRTIFGAIQNNSIKYCDILCQFL